MSDNISGNTNEFLTCDIARPRPGIRDALKDILGLVLTGQPVIAGCIAPRYGKSSLIRQLSLELFARRMVGCCLCLEPWIFLRDQMKDPDKVEDMIRQHAIPMAAFRPSVPVFDILTDRIEPDFYKQQPQRHLYVLTNGYAYSDATRLILKSAAAQCLADGRPMVVFIDESHLTSSGNYGWGQLAQELREAGAILILLTGTAERSDNLAPYGFQMEEVDRNEIQYKIPTVISMDEVRLDYYQADKVEYKLKPDVEVTLKQAWDEGCLTKLTHRLFTFKVDGEDVSEADLKTVRRGMGRALRDPETMRVAVDLLLDELRLRRVTADAGVAVPRTASIVFVGNDRADDEAADFHARSVRRLIIERWREYFPGTQPRIVIATMNNTDRNDRKAAKDIHDFVTGNDGDILIVKQMGSVGLDAPRIKVALDLSTIRTKSSTTQRWLRVATPLDGVLHATVIRPDDQITNDRWREIIEENGGQYVLENATLIDTKIVQRKNDPKPDFVITEPERSGATDNSLRLVDRDRDRELDLILARAPILANRLTRPELDALYKTGIFYQPEPSAPEEGPVLSSVLNISAEVDNCHRQIDEHCKTLANQEFTYGVHNEDWVSAFKRWMSMAKEYAGIKGDKKACRDLDKLKTAVNWLEAEVKSRRV